MNALFLTDLRTYYDILFTAENNILWATFIVSHKYGSFHPF